MPTPKLPVAHLTPVRSKNPLARQKVRAKLTSGGRKIGGTGEYHRSGGYALAMAVKSHGIVAFAAGTTEASNGHYRIRIDGWTEAERREAVRYLGVKVEREGGR